MYSQSVYTLRKRIVVGCDHSSVPGSAKIFGRIETKTTRQPHRPSASSAIFGSDCLRAVFNHRQPMLPGDSENLIHFGALPVKVDGKYRFSFGVDCSGKLSYVEVIGFGINIDKDRGRTGSSN